MTPGIHDIPDVCVSVIVKSGGVLCDATISFVAKNGLKYSEKKVLKFDKKNICNIIH